MAVDPNFHVNSHSSENILNSEWPIEKVIRWLEDNGCSTITHMFKEQSIYGPRFLNLTITELNALSQGSLPATDVWRLYNLIQSLRSEFTYNHHNEGTTTAYTQFGRQQAPATSSSTSQAPLLSIPPYNGASNNIPTTQGPTTTDTDYIKIKHLIPERKSSNPQQISKIVNDLQYDVSRIRPFYRGARIRPNGNQELLINVNGRTQTSPAYTSGLTATPTASSTPVTGAPASSTSTPNVTAYDWANSPISPRAQPNDPKGGWKIAGMRVQQYQDPLSQPGHPSYSTPLPQASVSSSSSSHPANHSQPSQSQPHPQYPRYPQYTPASQPQQPRQRIQVTADSNTFHSLTVTDMAHPAVIKDAILKKLNLDDKPYLYYHENGPMYYHDNGESFYAPLTDDELTSICRMSDDRLKDQVLVLSLDQIAPPYALDGRGLYPDIPSNYGYISHYQRPQATGYQQHHHMHYPRQGQLRQMESFDHQPPQPSYMQYDRPSPHNSPEMSTSPRPSRTTETAFQMPSELPPPSSTTTPAEECREDSGYFDRSYKRSSGRSTSSTECTPHFTPSDPSTGKTTPLNADPWYVRPQQPRPQPSVSSEVSLWHVRPKRSLEPLSDSDRRYSNGHDETVNNAQPASHSSSVQLWAVPPSNSSQNESRADSNYQSFAQGDLWPVDEDSGDSPQQHSDFGTPRLHPSRSTESMRAKRYYHGRHLSGEMSTIGELNEKDHNSLTEGKRVRSVHFITNKPLPNTPPDEEVERLSLHDEPVDTSNNRRNKLHIQIPKDEADGRSPRTPRVKTPLSATSSSPVSSSQEANDNEDEPWGERPSIEKLYRDIDKYLPGHDLDKEIFIEAPTATTPSPAPRRLGGHKKSIRMVAKDAHRNWRQAMNVIRVNNILRRRSTKMWGRKVEQVKPGMSVDQQAILDNQAAIRDAHSANAYAEKLTPTKMQWMRGQLIGKGSFGRVYHALNVAAGEWIAVKEVDSPITKSDMMNDKMRTAVDALYREIALLEDLDHENIVQYLGYDYDEDEGHIHIFLEYVPGGSIFSALNKNGRFEEVLVQFFTRQILLGLEYLHDRNIMHRDIKAGNILVDQNGVCKITDFGLSKLSGQDEAYDPNSNTLMKGTVFWMAPEVVKGSSYSAKIDIWSLGCTVIEMLTGKKPWLELNMLAALYSLGKYQAPPLPEDASEEAKDFLNQCFIINPDDRPTAAELLLHPFVKQNPSFKFKDYMKTLPSTNDANDI